MSSMLVGLSWPGTNNPGVYVLRARPNPGGVLMTYDANEIQQLRDEFRSARADAQAAQDVVTQAYELFLADKGAGSTQEQLAHLHKTHLIEESTCRKYVERLEELSGALTEEKWPGVR